VTPGTAPHGDRTVLRGGTLIAMDGHHGATPHRGDVAVQGGTITEVAEAVAARPGDRVIDATDHLLLPGLVNAHLHSSELLARGLFDALPLELWALGAYSAARPPPTPRQAYLRTMIVGLEAVKNGVTALLDDGSELESCDWDLLDAIWRAYEDLGIRASCSAAITDIPPGESLAGRRPTAGRRAPIDRYLRFCSSAAAELNRRSRRLRLVISPVSPQWCSDDLLVSAGGFARDAGLCLHTHVAETKLQATAFEQSAGSTMTAHLAHLGVLSSTATLAHVVWAEAAELDLIAEHGAAIVHNPISNLKLGSGIAGWRQWLRRGIPIGLGSDGVASNDSARLFDVMRLTALLHRATSPDFEDWPTAEEVLRAATLGGARCLLADASTGSLEAGKAADIVMLDAHALAFQPLNDPLTQLIHCENGQGVRLVMVDGRVVVADGRVQTVDERELIRAFEVEAAGAPAQAAVDPREWRQAEHAYRRVHRICGEAAQGPA
jgi:5-methylthioadenosine/S-adenosylhomocysteine deaminase